MIIAKLLKPLILFFYFVSFLSTSQEANNKIHIQIVTEHLPPFQIGTPTEVLGFATEIVKTAMLNTPYNFSIDVYPWTRAFKMTRNKENTCIYSIIRTPDREQQFIWVNTIAESNSSFIGLTERKLKITSFEDAKKYKTAVIRDDISHQILLKKGFKEGINLYVLNNTYSLLKLLSQRKGIDFILVDAYTIQYRARYNDLDASMFEKVFQSEEQPLNYYLACNTQTSPEIIKELRLSIQKMKVTGQLDRIISEWRYPNLKVK
ncbi:MAG: transporter substrate-binding domain-containing protein [Thalassotalea sp.]|nr:transporter substrate-binding domain-containing protein [Thalassotalea sp.]